MDKTLIKKQMDQTGRKLMEKSRSAKIWWEKLLYALGGILVLGASAYFLCSCTRMYEVNYDPDTMEIGVTIKPFPVKKSK